MYKKSFVTVGVAIGARIHSLCRDREQAQLQGGAIQGPNNVMIFTDLHTIFISRSSWFSTTVCCLLWIFLFELKFLLVIEFEIT